ncbi:FAD-dependent oxidoreductase, partial [Pseudomonas sp. SIMBA_044]|uniref:FAD-dependent oxidoreductase n=1 Tax=Pseudomonas sp. SIMBA_044 TaxID=3085785 RepID=UPI00397D07B8
ASLGETIEPKLIAAAERYEAANIRLLNGVSMESLDAEARNMVLSDGAVISYDKLLLATGASAREFPGAPAMSARIRALRTHQDAIALRGVM